MGNVIYEFAGYETGLKDFLTAAAKLTFGKLARMIITIMVVNNERMVTIYLALLCELPDLVSTAELHGIKLMSLNGKRLE